MNTLSAAESLPGFARAYRAHALRRVGILLALLALLAVLFLVDVASGPARLSLDEIMHGLWASGRVSPDLTTILWGVRVPFALMALLVGCALGLAGAEMQTALNNPLASPFTLGVSAAASVGASLVVISGWTLVLWDENLALTLGAFGCASLATLLTVWLAWRHGASTETVVLFGIALMFSFEAVLWLLQYLADSNALQQIVFWTMGSMTRATWNKIAILALVLFGCVVWSVSNVWTMTLLRAGEEQARSLGIQVERLRLLTLLRVSLLAATALSFVGTIGFVGLVGPHIARLLVGEDHRFYLPASMLAGAVVLSGASILSKTLIAGVVLPIGIITALVGVPLFLFLITRSRRKHG